MSAALCWVRAFAHVRSAIEADCGARTLYNKGKVEDTHDPKEHVIREIEV
jgi:hypothetical protein